MTSQELSKKWNLPLRLLWIDGDHSFKGAQDDYLGFCRHLQEGGIVAFHDIINGFSGPLQVFSNEVVQDKRFGACGIVGSIGWAQYIGKKPNHFLKEKEILYIKLAKLLPHVANPKMGRIEKFQFKIKRAFIRHNMVNENDWVAKIG